MSDPIDQAIAATEQPEQVRMVQRTWRMSTGRPFVVSIPVDMSDAELQEAAGHMSIIGWQQMAMDRQGARPSKPQLVLARGSLPSLRPS